MMIFYTFRHKKQRYVRLLYCISCKVISIIISYFMLRPLDAWTCLYTIYVRTYAPHFLIIYTLISSGCVPVPLFKEASCMFISRSTHHVSLVQVHPSNNTALSVEINANHRSRKIQRKDVYPNKTSKRNFISVIIVTFATLNIWGNRTDICHVHSCQYHTTCNTYPTKWHDSFETCYEPVDP